MVAIQVQGLMYYPIPKYIEKVIYNQKYDKHNIKYNFTHI